MKSDVTLTKKSENEVRAILRELRRHLEGLYGDRLRGLYLYGSYARGDAEAESDVDILVVLDELKGYVTEVRRIGPIISDLSLEHETTINPAFTSETEWNEHATPFLTNVRKEGVAA